MLLEHLSECTERGGVEGGTKGGGVEGGTQHSAPQGKSAWTDEWLLFFSACFLALVVVLFTVTLASQ